MKYLEKDRIYLKAAYLNILIFWSNIMRTIIVKVLPFTQNRLNYNHDKGNIGPWISHLGYFMTYSYIGNGEIIYLVFMNRSMTHLVASIMITINNE